MHNNNPWIDYKIETPPCSGEYEVTTQSDQFDISLWSILHYNGYGFNDKMIYYDHIKFWREIKKEPNERKLLYGRRFKYYGMKAKVDSEGILTMENGEKFDLNKSIRLPEDDDEDN